MRNQDEVRSLLAKRGLNTVRFQAFVFEAREAGPDVMGGLCSASVEELEGALQAVESAYQLWMSHE